MVKLLFVLSLFVPIAFVASQSSAGRVAEMDGGANSPLLDGLFGPEMDSGQSDSALLGKPCGSVMDCGYGLLFCIEGICQEKRAGVDCVAAGQIWTGAKGCCPPMANPHVQGQPCKYL
ncbi:hypothetical protein BCR42DRAFT_425459 [Absidia repens]|uniref:Uncharacterized protein n=1 Tax=Absidia repens TaxID=90262 RepID=A0A1X2I4F8_9FUNG|nr:hypothetical protein BCR42DRAFT_425459 [Absidia repens]